MSDGYGERPLASGHICCFVDCGEPAWFVIVEAHSLAMLFKSGAGLVCPAHREECLRIGGLDVMPIGLRPEHVS